MGDTSVGIDNNGFESGPSGDDASDKVRAKEEDGGGTNLEDCDFEAAMLHTGFGKYNILLLSASFPAFLGALITTSSTAMILPSAECDLDLSSFEMGLMNSISYIGMVCFAFLWGFLSDKFGRRKILVAAFLMDVAVTVCYSLAQTFELFITMKLFSGFVSAAPYALLMTYLAECHSSKYRASAMVWTGTLGALCNIFLPALAWLIIPLPIRVTLAGGMISLQSWRIFLLVCGIPSLVAAGLLFLLSESPKFLMSSGRTDEAMKVFKTMYRLNTGKPEDTFPVKSLKKEMSAEKSAGRYAFFSDGLNQIKPLFRKPYISKMLLIFAVHSCNFAGLNTVRLWIPQIFSLMLDKEESSGNNYSADNICDLLSRDFVNTTHVTEFISCSEHLVQTRVYINSMIVGVVNGIGYLICSYLVAVMGKKPLIILTFVFATGCTLGMYWSTDSDTVMGVTAVFVTLGSISSTTLISVIVDLIPTNQRSMAVSLALMFGRCGSMVGNMMFALLIQPYCTAVFFLLCGILLACTTLSLLLPKTKGAALK